MLNLSCGQTVDNSLDSCPDSGRCFFPIWYALRTKLELPPQEAMRNMLGYIKSNSSVNFDHIEFLQQAVGDLGCFVLMIDNLLLFVVR